MNAALSAARFSRISSIRSWGEGWGIDEQTTHDAPGKGAFLDTHPRHREACAELNREVRLTREATSRYEENFGPLTVGSAAAECVYRWTDNPWPWESEA